MLCWRPWERFSWKKQNCAPWTDLFQTSYIGNRYKLHRQWILKNSDIILLDGNRFTFNEPELEWLSHYSVGFTTALHSINCLVVSPLWWSRKRLWAVSSAAIFCMSSASSSKSKRFRFSCILSLWTVFGMMITSLCSSQRKATWAAVLPYFSPIWVRVGKHSVLTFYQRSPCHELGANLSMNFRVSCCWLMSSCTFPMSWRQWTMRPGLPSWKPILKVSTTIRLPVRPWALKS